MKQVTGKINHSDKNSLSIRIILNGLSFFNKETNNESFIDFSDKQSIKSILNANIISSLNVSVVSSRFVMMPDELYDSTKDYLYLTAKGITVNSDEFIMSSVFESIRFIFPVTSSMREFLSFANRLCGEVIVEHAFTKNLKYSKDCPKGQITLSYFDDSVYLSYNKDNKLIFADVFDADSIKMIADFVEILIQNLGLKKTPILLVNDFDNSLRTVLTKKYDVKSISPSVYYSDSF